MSDIESRRIVFSKVDFVAEEEPLEGSVGIRTNLLLGALVGFDGVVDVLHGPFDHADRVRPLGVRVHTLVGHGGGDVPEHGLQLRLPLLV